MPNHPTAPVLESVVGPVPTNCESLKLKYGIVTRKHRKGSGNKRKESHHILQDKAMKGLISKYSGWAVLLNGGSGGEHDVVNAAQVARNCPGPGPKTFGELLKASTEDLEKALVGKVKDGNTMSKAEAKAIAKCLVAEAEEETQKARKDKDRKPLNADSRVKQVEGCLPAGTLVWLNDFERVPVEQLTEGMSLQFASESATITRVERCAGRVVEMALGGFVLALAGHHRVRLDSRRMLRADMLQRGSLVDTDAGPLVVTSVRLCDEVVPLYRFQFAKQGACRIGDGGVWVEVPPNEVRVAAHADVVTG